MVMPTQTHRMGLNSFCVNICIATDKILNFDGDANADVKYEQALNIEQNPTVNRYFNLTQELFSTVFFQMTLDVLKSVFLCFGGATQLIIFALFV